MTDKIILPTDTEAATFVENISGWVSRDGFFYGKDERTARYIGSTHTACKTCGVPYSKNSGGCNPCRDTREKQRYDAMEKVEWDDVGMLYSMTSDKYFDTWEEIEDYCDDEDNHADIKELRLVICEPVYLDPVNEDRWADDLQDGQDLPDEVYTALEEFNKVLREVGPVSWTPGNKAAIV